MRMEPLIIFGGKYLFFLAPLVALWVFYKTPREAKKNLAVFGMIVLILSYLVSVIAGMLYSHPQPFALENITPLIAHEVDNSFPSHHTLLVAAIASVIYLYNRRVGSLLFLLALLVGMSRVLAGIHHPIDVVASILIAALVTWVVDRVYNKKTG